LPPLYLTSGYGPAVPPPLIDSGGGDGTPELAGDHGDVHAIEISSITVCGRFAISKQTAARVALS